MRRLHHPHLDSTNAEAHRLIARGEPCPLLITATTQSAGRGRDGRLWSSPKGGLWMSAVWPITKPPEFYQPFPLVVGLAVHDAVLQTVQMFGAHFPPHRLQLKWPNDLLLDDRKLCGILCETVTSSGALTHLIAGVGINVAFPTSDLQGPFRQVPTTLHDVLGADSNWIDPLTTQFIRALTSRLQQFEQHGFNGDLRNNVNRHLAWVGKTCTWAIGETHRHGTIVEVDESGHLLLESAGQRLTLSSGEILSDSPKASSGTMI